MLKQFDISGKNIIITGAARGIGKGIIRVLAESGANILCTALTDVYLKKLAEELLERSKSLSRISEFRLSRKKKFSTGYKAFNDCRWRNPSAKKTQ